MQSRATLSFLFCMLLPTPAMAIHKCTDDLGNVSFQDQPCARNESTTTISIRDGKRRILIPGENWGLAFTAPNVREIEHKTRGLANQYFASSTDGFVMSVFIEPAAGKGTDKQSCGVYYWQLTAKNPDIIASTVDRVDGEDFTIVSYAIKVPFKQDWLVQGNYNIYGYHNDRCIDIHLSRLFPSDDAISFEEFIRFAVSLEYVDA